MTELIYKPPLIVSFDPGTHKEVDFTKYNAGKFVVIKPIEKGEVKLYGLLYVLSIESKAIDMFNHRGLLTILIMLGKEVEIVDLWLGGGLLSFNHSERTLEASGTSERFGNVPVSLTERCLDGLGYHVLTNGLNKRARSNIQDKKVVDWYKNHGFEV